MKPDAKGNGICFNTPEEGEMVEGIFTQAIQSLSEADREMPPVVEILKLLKAGIAVHHSGLLPILKEVVEILFQEGLIKVWAAHFIDPEYCIDAWKRLHQAELISGREMLCKGLKSP